MAKSPGSAAIASYAAGSRASVRGRGTAQCSKSTRQASTTPPPAASHLPARPCLAALAMSHRAPKAASTARASMSTTLKRFGTRLALTRGR